MFEARLNVELAELCEQNEDSFLAEFNSLGSKSLQHFKARAKKCDFSREEALIFELLCEIKTTLDEQNLARKSSLLPLAHSTFSKKIGFENIELESAFLRPGADYYVRIEISAQILAVFARATCPSELEILRIKRDDEELLNSYVADVQRHLIYQHKEKNNASRFDN